jgi:hypothetical protein
MTVIIGTVPRESVGLSPALEGEPANLLHYTSGILGSRRVIEREDGTFLNVLPEIAEQDITTEDVILRRCVPVAFYQEITHRRREGKRDERVREQPGPDNHPGVRLSIETLHLKHNNLPLTHHAQGQLCGHARVPIEYYHRLVKQGVLQLAALNVNTGVKLRAVHIRGAREGEFLIRVKDDEVRAVLTDDYGIFDNHDMLDAFVQCFPDEMIPELMVSQFWSDGDDVEGTVLVPNEWTNEPGHVFGIGIAFKNSEIGKRSMNFKPFVTRNGRGGLMFDKRDTTNGVMEVKHSPSMTVDSVKTQIRANVPALLRSANSLRTHLINSMQITIPNPREVLAALAIRFGIPANTSRLWYRNWINQSLSAPHIVQESETSRLAELVPFNSNVFYLLDSLMETTLSQSSETQMSMQSMAGQMLIDQLDQDEAGLTTYWMSQMIPAGQRLARRSNGVELIREYTVGQLPPVVTTTERATRTTRTGTRRS